MSRDSLSFSWRADDEVGVSHVLIVEHQSVPAETQQEASVKLKVLLGFISAAPDVVWSNQQAVHRPLSEGGVCSLPAVPLLSDAVVAVWLI